jgi:uncharacterized protein YbjT (DUF2867 family)
MILVTGATGNIGQELVPQLLEAKQRVRVFVRDSRKVSHLADRVEIAEGDFNQPKTLVEALRGVEKAFLVFLDMGTQPVENFTERAKRAEVKHIVKLSTFNAGRPKLRIDQWHHAKEEIIRSSGIAWTFVRPGQFMSNCLRWAATIKQEGVVYFPGGDSEQAPIHPRDIAAVAAAALIEPGHEGQAYEFTGPQLLTVGQQVEILGRVIGHPLKYVDVPEEVAGEQMKRSGLPGPVVDAVVEMFKELRKNSLELSADTVEKVTGHAARTFEEWCRENAETFRSPSAGLH